jgi:flagellar basal-body rod protein FlgF
MDLTVVAANAMQQDAARLQGIAQNLSNVLTPGYKKQVSSTQSFATQLAAASQGNASPLRNLTLPTTQVLIDATAGTLRSTGNLLDVAIDGDGFFELADVAGPVYTRRGEFRTDAAGRLVGPQGLPVMGAGGEIVLTGEPFTIAANGEITQAGAVVARLRVVHLTHAEAMNPQGGGTYAQGGAVLENTAAPVRLRIGYQENSNVDSAREMVGMTETVRHFESMQKLMQGYDEVLEKSIRKLGEF